MEPRPPGAEAEHGSARDPGGDAWWRQTGRRFADLVRRWPVPVAWAMVLALLLGAAFWSSRSGSGECGEPKELAELPSASERPTESEAPAASDGVDQAPGADEGSTTMADSSTEAGTPPHVLQETGDQPAVIALGRSRGVRRARMTFNPAVSEEDREIPTEPPATEPPPSNSEPASDPSDASIPLAQVEGPEPIVVALNPLLRKDGLPLRLGGTDGVMAEAFAFSRSGVVTVELCVSRKGRAIHPGTYNGSVGIVDKRVQPISAQFEVRAAYPNIFLVGALAWLSTGSASFYTWLLRERRRSDERLRLRGFSEWLLTRTGLLAMASGTIAGYVAFAATYLANPTWGVTPSHVTAIVGAVFSAFVTAATTILVSASD